MLTERQLLILQAIVDNYISSAEPVGSRAISKRGDVSYSAATIRNEMADLEDLGYIEKPHSSSGRVPSQKGYRYYVDHLLMPKRLTAKELNDIYHVFERELAKTEDIIQQLAKILSNITSYISVVLGPEMYEAVLQHIQITPLSERKAVFIIVTDNGHVENHLIATPQGITSSDLEKMMNILNERLRGVPLYQLRNKIQDEVAGVLKEHVTNYHQILAAINDVLKREKQDKIFYGGKTNILTQPEFRDVEKVRTLLDIFEEEALVQQLLRSDTGGIRVKIGEENNVEAFENCSVITASYSIDGKNMGTVGIVGPTRMEYRRVISILNFLSKDLTKVLTDLYQKG